MIRDEQRQALRLILDNSDQMKARFDHFLGLVDCAKLGEISYLDKVNLQSLSKCAKLLDFVRLEADLIGLYSSQTMRNECKSPRRLLNFLAHKDLIQLFLRQHSCFSWSFSALKRNKTYSWGRTVPPWQ